MPKRLYPLVLSRSDLESVISLKVHKSIYRRMLCGWKLISNPCTWRDITELESVISLKVHKSIYRHMHL